MSGNRKYLFNYDPNSNMLPVYDLSRTMTIYQIAIHPNPKSDKHHVKRITIEIDNDYKVVETKEMFLIRQKVDEIVNTNLKYKLYSTYNLNYVDLPSIADINLFDSKLLNDNNGETVSYASPL